MKFALAFLLPSVVFLCLLSTTMIRADHSNSLEAKNRKDTCGGLVEKDPDSHSGSHSEEEDGTLPPSPTSGSPATRRPHYHCTLTDSLRNFTRTMEDGVDKDELRAFILEIEITILLDVTLTDEEKVVKCSYALKKFLDVHVNIKQKLLFLQIGSWGLFFDFMYVSIDIQAELVVNVITLDADENCPLFDALLNATAGDSEKHAACLEIIDEIRVILLDVSLTEAQKKAKIHLVFKAFFDLHPDWKDFFLSIEIEGFGSLESLDDVCHGFDRAMTLDKVIGGSSDSDCAVCKALTEASANTTFSLSVRSQIKAFHDKIVAFFATTVDIQLRITYISSQFYQMELMEPWIVEYLFQISLTVEGEEWGCFYDILWCSQFCYNSGSCGNLNGGMGTSQAPSTTKVPTTTRAPVDCGARPNLIVVSAQNTTILTNAILVAYNSWNSTVRTGFNTCFNRVRIAIWDNVKFPTSATKIAEIISAFKAYNPNNPDKQAVAMNIVIPEWNSYTMRDFCNCN